MTVPRELREQLTNELLFWGIDTSDLTDEEWFSFASDIQKLRDGFGVSLSDALFAVEAVKEY